jgi:prepilin-type processing-associated H-X9-DG protein
MSALPANTHATDDGPCARAREHALELVRGRPGDVPDDVRLHVAGCAACGALAAGAGALGDRLAAWEPPPPPDDLVERALAGLALAAAAPPARRRRTSVELLTSPPLAGGEAGEPPAPRRLLLRLVVQAAAAAALFVVCGGFVVAYYPAIAQAFEDGRVRRCQQRLGRLKAAALLYRAERPEAPALRGAPLRRALVQGGYLDELELVCPGHHGEALGERSYYGELPAGAEPLPTGRALFWDRFGNHSSGFNVVYADGRVETVTVDALGSWHRRMSGEAVPEDEDPREE